MLFIANSTSSWLYRFWHSQSLSCFAESQSKLPCAAARASCLRRYPPARSCLAKLSGAQIERNACGMPHGSIEHLQAAMSKGTHHKQQQQQPTMPTTTDMQEELSREHQATTSKYIITTSSAGQHNGWGPVASNTQCPCQNVRVTNDLQTTRGKQTTTNTKNT